MDKMIELLNTIRDNASATYQDRIPEATRENLEEIRYSMIDGDNIQVANEFMNTLLNKIVKSVIHTKMFTNPLKALKQGAKPLGDTIEEIYNNFLKGSEYDPTGKNLLNRHLPDTKTVYHRMNYKMQYPITVSREALSKAFVSYESLESYVTSLMNSLYNSAELDEFVNMKQILKSAIDKKAMKCIQVADPVISKENGQEFIKSVKTVSGLMAFPSTEFNGYLDVQSEDKEPITTFSRKNEQVLILDTATDTSVAIDVLASVFNMTVAEFNDTKKIVIDTFPDKRIRAVLVDEAFFQIYDDLFNVTSFNNGMGLYENFYLNVWQTLAYSPLVNAVAFVVAGEPVTITYGFDGPSGFTKYTDEDIANYGFPSTANKDESLTIQFPSDVSITKITMGDIVVYNINRVSLEYATSSDIDETGATNSSSLKDITIYKVTDNIIIQY